MLFVTTWETPMETRDETIAKFKEGGGLPPEGIKLIGRWHFADDSGGVAVFETDDAELIAKWAMEWSNLIAIDVRPVVDDEAFGRVLS